MIKVYIENLTNEIVSDIIVRDIRHVIRTAVKDMYPNHKFECNVFLCNNEYIRNLNREQRGINRTTDVLSFPIFEFDKPNILCSLGDIVISLNTAHAQAFEYGHTFKRELCFLALHGTLHLLGYDHIEEEDREKMEAKQREILDRLEIKR